MLQRLLSLLLLPFALLLTRVSPPPEVPAKIVLTENKPACSPYQTSDTVCGAAGSRFYIQRPKSDALTSVSADAFGMGESVADNTQAFMDAITYCGAHPDTELVISPGVYRFTQTERIVLSGLRNVFIEGEGAEFIFCTPGRQILITGCDSLEIHGLAIDHDRMNDPIDDVVRIQNADPRAHTLDFCFFEKTDADESMAIKVVVDIIPELWQEGTGVNTLEIRGNTFENCVVGENSEVITLSTDLNGSPADGYAFENIEIVDNTFTAFPGSVVNASNVNGFRFAGNTVITDRCGNALYFGASCENLQVQDNDWQGRGALIAKLPRCKTLREWILLHSGAQTAVETEEK